MATKPKKSDQVKDKKNDGKNNKWDFRLDSRSTVVTYVIGQIIKYAFITLTSGDSGSNATTRLWKNAKSRDAIEIVVPKEGDADVVIKLESDIKLVIER